MRRTALSRSLSAKILALTVACVLLAIISCLGMWQVLARFVFSQPTTWTEESMRRLLIWMVMLGAMIGVRDGSHFEVPDEADNDATFGRPGGRQVQLRWHPRRGVWRAGSSGASRPVAFR